MSIFLARSTAARTNSCLGIAGIVSVLAGIALWPPASGDVSSRINDAPNVIIIMSDDAGYADFGFHGSASFVTPQLDRIAARGVVFSNAYASSSVCTPSRAGLMTGRYANRFGIEFNLPGDPGVGIPTAERGLTTTERTIAEILSEKGYQAGFIGKWHLGDQDRFRPENRGFKEYFGILGGYTGYHPESADSVVSNYRSVNPGSLPYLTDAFGDEAVGFVERHKDTAFFLQVSFTAPHAPMQVREDDLKRFYGRFKRDIRAKNAAMLYRMDENIGKILSAVESFDLLENTLVIFTNDNGGSLADNGASNFPLRGGKGTVLEGGIKVPLVVSWPALVEGGTVIKAPVSTLDILPTVVAAAGFDLPADRVYDGVSLLPVLTDHKLDPPHDTLFWRVNWASAVRKGNWKLVRAPDSNIWLYNLGWDPGESTDRANEEKLIVTELLSELHSWESSMKAPVWLAHKMWKRRATKLYYR